MRFVLECDSEVANEVATSLIEEANAEVSSATKRNLDGSPETVLQIVEVSLAAVNTILPLVIAWVSRKGVRKIRVGEVEIENPTPEQVEVLWREHLASQRDA